MFEIGYMLGVSHNRCFGIYPEHGQLACHACRVLRAALDLDLQLQLRLAIGVLFVQARISREISLAGKRAFWWCWVV